MSARMRFAGLLATAAALTLGVAPLASAAVTAPAPRPGPGQHHGHQHNPWDDDGYGSCGYHYCYGYPYGSDYGKGDGGHHTSPYGARADHDPRGRYGGWGHDDGPIDGWSYHDVDGSWCWRNWC